MKLFAKWPLVCFCSPLPNAAVWDLSKESIQCLCKKGRDDDKVMFPTEMGTYCAFGKGTMPCIQDLTMNKLYWYRLCEQSSLQLVGNGPTHMLLHVEYSRVLLWYLKELKPIILVCHYVSHLGDLTISGYFLDQTPLCMQQWKTPLTQVRPLAPQPTATGSNNNDSSNTGPGTRTKPYTCKTT